MISFYVRKGYPVPISSQEFQIGLAQRFIERDGMYFADQAAEYDRKRWSVEPASSRLYYLFPTASLSSGCAGYSRESPRPFDINRVHAAVGLLSKNEAQLDLRELLNQNFSAMWGRLPAGLNQYRVKSTATFPATG